MKTNDAKKTQELRIEGLFDEIKTADLAREIKYKEYSSLASDQDRICKLKLRQLNEISLSRDEKEAKLKEIKKNYSDRIKSLRKYSKYKLKYSLEKFPEKERREEQKSAMMKLLDSNENNNLPQQDDDESSAFSIKTLPSENAVQDDLYSQVPFVNEPPMKSWSSTILSGALAGGFVNIGFSSTYWNWVNGTEESNPFKDNPLFVFVCVIKGITIGTLLGVIIKSINMKSMSLEENVAFPKIVTGENLKDIESQRSFSDNVSAMTDTTDNRLNGLGF